MDDRRRLPGAVFPLILAAVLLNFWVAGTENVHCPPPKAAPARTPVLDQPDTCDYYEGGRRWAYYGNCTDKWVLVTVDAAFFPDTMFRVPPGEAHNLLDASTARGVYDVRSC